MDISIHIGNGIGEGLIAGILLSSFPSFVPVHTMKKMSLLVKGHPAVIRGILK